MEEKVLGKPLFDEFIDTGDWPRQDLNMGLYGDAILFLGKSPGTTGELAYAVYMYKIVYGFKSGVEQPIETIHKQARAGRNMPFTVYIYEPFILGKKLSAEDELYTRKFGINLVYVKNSSDLEKKLRKLENQ